MGSKLGTLDDAKRRATQAQLEGLATGRTGGWRPDRVVVRHMYGRTTAACDGRGHGLLSHTQRNALFPCVGTAGFGGVIVHSMDAPKRQAGAKAKGGGDGALPRCRYDGFSDTGRHRGVAYARDVQPLWVPSGCAAHPFEDSLRSLEPLRLALWGDSITAVVHDSLKKTVQNCTFVWNSMSVGRPHNEGI